MDCNNLLVVGNKFQNIDLLEGLAELPSASDFATTEAGHKLPANQATGPATRTTNIDQEYSCTRNNNQRENHDALNEIQTGVSTTSNLTNRIPGFNDSESAVPQNVAVSTTTTATTDHKHTCKPRANRKGLAKEVLSGKKKKNPAVLQLQNESVETELLSEIADAISKSDRQSIYKQCNELLQKISDKKQVLSMEEILQIVQDWKPKQEILCLYVRIARKLPANFHLDSISTLLCISKQCGYTPVNFLTKTKCLQVTPSGGRYGFAFMFKTTANRTVDGDALDRKFVGLSLTLTLLEHSVSNSCGVISRDGMRSRVPREPVNKQLDLGGSSKISFKAMPSNEFHKKTSLINRLWLAVNHRWMSFHLVQQLFICKDNLCENDAILVYSFMMHASCGKSRYQFLDPMVGICFRFITRDDIEANRSRLKELWNNPSNFLTFGHHCLQRDNEERKVRILVETFTEMKRQFTRTTSYGRAIDQERRWLMLRAYIFSFWLKRECNTPIRSQLESGLASHCSIAVTSGKPSASTAKAGGCVKIRNTPNLTADLSTIPESASKRRRLNCSSSDNQIWSPAANNLNTSGTEKKDTSMTGNTSEPLGPTLPFCPIATRATLLGKDWSSIRIVTQSELDEVAASYLLVHTDGGLDILSKLSPLEVYSADRLKDFRHSRVCGPPGYYPSKEIGDVILQIGSGTDEFLDKYSRLFHIARHRSVYFKEYRHLLPSDRMFSNLCKSILKYGNIDDTRSKSQYRVNIGCAGQHFPEGVPATLIGKGFGRKLENDNAFDATEILSTIGLLVEFLWCIAQDMQRDVSDAPLAPDPLRWRAYAKHLCTYLLIDNNVGFEDITLVLSPIHGSLHDVVAEHTDVMNDHLGGYSRTCVFNACLSLDCGTLMHMQVIGNFRRTVRQYMVPFEKSLQSTIANGKHYIASWKTNMQLIFAGVSPNQKWDPFNRAQFFLDDDLPFESISIFDGTSKRTSQPISLYGDYLLTEIGLSRVTSFSMFIDPLYKAKDLFSTDQRVELIFFASLLSNPFWFHYSLEKLIERNNSPNQAFSFGIHPVYDMVDYLYATFGTWQGGPHNRWSPCGGAVPVVQLFGAHPQATDEEKRLGTVKLEAIVEVLFGHLEWINSLQGKGLDPLVDLPLSCIQVHFESIRKQIYDVVPCQFSLFRLSVFTTIVIGCNELLSGPHLKQIMIPFPGTSSFKHLLAPSKGQISKQSAIDLSQNTKEAIVQPNEDDRVVVDDHDRLMLYLSNSFGRKKYVRDEMECLLCESHPGRSLECRDWFCRGQNIFDCSDDGIVLIRAYGKESEWKPVGAAQIWSFRYLNNQRANNNYVDKATSQSVYYKVDKSIAAYADLFGLELRQFNEKIVFNGRNSTRAKQNSEHYDNPFLHRSMGKNHLRLHHFRSANLFSSQHYKETKKERMIVLGDGEKPRNLFHECNQFESFDHGMPLLNKVRESIEISCGARKEYDSMVAGCYHQENGDCVDRITYFPAHLDKCYIDYVWFVPLSQKQFFTFVAVPSSWNVQQDLDSMQEYKSWLDDISYDEQKMVQAFRDLFQRDASKFMKHTSVTSLVFSNKLGSVLQFPANSCFHASVIPAQGHAQATRSHRDLLIIHPLVTM